MSMILLLGGITVGSLFGAYKSGDKDFRAGCIAVAILMLWLLSVVALEALNIT